MTSEEHALVHQREQFLAGELQNAEQSRDIWKSGFISSADSVPAHGLDVEAASPRGDRSEALVPGYDHTRADKGV